METISTVRWLATNSTHCPFPTSQFLLLPTISPIHRLHPKITSISVSRISPPPVSEETVEEDVLQMFFQERQLNGDSISKFSDMLWQRGFMKFVDSETGTLSNPPQQSEEAAKSDYEGGFLKLARTQEWVLGYKSAPINKKAIAKALRDDSERRKKLDLLNYEALKREMLLLSVGIGTACSGYCLLALSVQAAMSYATGVVFRIGIRSEDLKDFLERTVKGSGIALSSPRLVIPVSIYGLWVLSHQHFASNFFDFQIVPAMFGMFAYKAAALVQVYRDNEDLQLVFP